MAALTVPPILQQAYRTMLDSPALHRDRESLFTAWRLCLWFSVANVVNGGVLALALSLAALPSVSAVSEHLGVGRLVVCTLFTGLGLVLTVLIPMRAIGMIWTARAGRYFDQLVLTGISPYRLLSGKILGCNLLVGTLLAGSVPYFAFALGFGGINPLDILGGVLMLLLYANMLNMATLAMSTVAHEVGAALTVIVVFGTAYFVGIFPLPAFLGVFSPAPALMAPIYQGHIESTGDLELLVRSVRLVIPAWSWFAIGGLLSLAWATALFIVGPLNGLTRINSTFGEVILPGDAKRKRAARRRPMLALASEMSFFFENREPAIDAWDPPLRWGTLITMPVALAVLGTAAVHVWGPQQNEEQIFYLLNFLVLSAALGLAGALLCNDRGTESCPVSWRGLRTNAGALHTLCWLVVTTACMALATVPPFLRDWLQGPNGWLGTSPDVSPLHGLAIGQLILLANIVYYGLTRWIGMSTWTAGMGPVGAALLYFGVIGFAPLIAMAPLVAMDDVIRGSEQIGYVVGAVSPFPFVLTMLDANESFFDFIEEGGWLITFIVHLALALLAVLMAWRRHRQVLRERSEDA